MINKSSKKKNMTNKWTTTKESLEYIVNNYFAQSMHFLSE